MPGEPIPADLFRVSRDDVDADPGQLGTIISDCDWLTAGPADLRRVAPGIRDGLVDLARAGPACAYALKDDPDNPRFAFQLGRVLDIAGLHDWARFYYLMAADRGYPAALTNLGYMYNRGIGVPQSYDKSLALYKKASEYGDLRARTNVGTQFLRGQGTAADPVEAVQWIKLASEVGWVNAQNSLADRYRLGEGVPKDTETAASLYELAALNGQRAAMNNLGRLLLTGDGVERSRAEAYRWLERGIAAGDRFAPFTLARDLESNGQGMDDPQRVLDLFELSWRRGNVRAQLDLAWIYDAGDLVPRDPTAAYRSARRAELDGLEKGITLARRLRDELGFETATRIDTEIDMEIRLNGR